MPIFALRALVIEKIGKVGLHILFVLCLGPVCVNKENLSKLILSTCRRMVSDVFIVVSYNNGYQWRKSRWGGRAAAPHTFVENDEFSEILTYKRAKNSLFECKWGGGFVGNLKVLSEI